MTVMRPEYSLTLGGQRFTKQAIEIALTLDIAPVVDALSAVFPAILSIDAAPGDDVSLVLGNGDAEEQVFSGTIEAIHRGFDRTRVRALNAGGVLARFRPAVTYEQISAGDVVRNVCDAAGVRTGEVADGVALAFYAADPSRNAYEHIARVAGWSGAITRVSADDEVEMLVVNAIAAEAALQFGRDLVGIDFEAREAPIETFAVAGESGAGTTGAADALRPTTDFFGGNRPPEPSRTARWTSAPALRTARAAASARTARGRTYAAGRVRGTFSALLQPSLRPGVAIHVRNLPAGLPNDVLLLRRVRHVIGLGGAITAGAFTRGGGASSALLGSAAAALGF
jgi:hypothetical protein